MAHFVYPAANPQPAAAYPTVQTAYVAAAPQAAYAAAAAPRAAGAYEGYQATHATPQYAYTTRTQVAVTVSRFCNYLHMHKTVHLHQQDVGLLTLNINLISKSEH